MDELAVKLIKRSDTLKANRQQHESVWRECYDYTYPLRGAGFSDEVLDAQSAKHKVAKLLDGTATDSARMLASALMSGMTGERAMAEPRQRIAAGRRQSLAVRVRNAGVGKHPRRQLRRRGL